MFLLKLSKDIKSPPALPEPTDILPESDDDDFDENPADLLEQCIRTGITKKANKAPSESSGIQLNIACKPAAREIVKENPIGMLRKGGNAYIDVNTYDETNPFHIEDSPCNYSVASGLSDLTVGSHTAGVLKINRFVKKHTLQFVFNYNFQI